MWAKTLTLLFLMFSSVLRTNGEDAAPADITPTIIANKKMIANLDEEAVKSRCKRAQRLVFTPFYDTFLALGAQILHHLASSYHTGYQSTWLPIKISNGEDFVDSRLGQKAK